MRHIEKEGIVYFYDDSKGHPLISRSDIMYYNTSRRNKIDILDYLESIGEYPSLVIKLKENIGRLIRYRDVPKPIRKGSYQTHVDLHYLKSTIDDYIRDFNLDLNPEFQRGHVWTHEQRVKFVEYMIRDGRMNPIYFNCKHWNDYKGKQEMVIVDGLQRLTTLLMFVKDELRIFKELGNEGLGFLYSEFDYFRLSADSMVRININDLETDKEILQWYLELNEGQTPHTKEELERVRQLLSEVE